MTTLDRLSPAARRAVLRQDPALRRQLERLAALAPGGSPSHPIALTSASLVEVRANSTPCPLCGGELRAHDHTAQWRGEALVRIAHVKCVMCAAERELFYRVVPHGTRRAS